MANRDPARRARRVGVRTTVLTATAVGLVQVAQAQTVTAAASEQGGGAASAGDGSDIIVTARRRQENVMRVPDTVSVFGERQIETRRLNQISDFIALTPNVRIAQEQDAATNEIFIRGIGSDRNQAASVAFVVDGVVLPDPDAFTTDLSDATQVEILKGPQGALYGKGALAGAINIVTRAPTNDFSGVAKASYGSGHLATAYLSAGGPLVQDKLLAQFSIKYQHFDGTLVNRFDGKPMDHNNFVRPSARVVFTPVDGLKFDLVGSYYRQRAGNPPYTLYNLIGPPGIGNGGIVDSRVARTPISQNDPSNSRRSVYSVSLTASYAGDWGTLTSITAYDLIHFSMYQDLDFTPYTLALVPLQNRNTRGISQEVRFVSPDDRPFRYIVGAYYQDTRRFLNTFISFDSCLLGLGGNCTVYPPTPSGNFIPLHAAQNVNYDRQWAGFAQASYDVASQLEVTGALRYDLDQRKQVDDLLGRIDRKSFHDWEPKASISYKPTGTSTYYATYAHGYKTGLFNAFNTVGGNKPLVVQPEQTDGFEVGTKQILLDRKLNVTAAAFYTNYKNAQEYSLDVQSGGQANINVRKSRIYGFEAEAHLRPVDHLELNAAFGYTKSKILDFNGTGVYVGQPLPYSPLYTLNAGAQYTIPIGDRATISPRVDFARYGREAYQDFQNPDTTRLIIQRPYNTMDAQIAYNRGALSVTVYGRNIFATHYVQSAYSRYISALIFGVNGDLIAPAPAATFGGEIRVKF